MSAPKNVYINTAISYVNARPHIGHAVELLYADVIARYHRQKGDSVLFVTGTDEHGQKISQSAAAAGIEPQQFVDQMSQTFSDLCTTLNLSNDDFIRTTEQRHRDTAQLFWKRVQEAGAIVQSEYEGLYCVGCEEFKSEKDLVDGLCPDHKKAPEVVKEQNYFFQLSRYQDQLRALLATPGFVVPKSRAAEMNALLDEGVEDISISRDVSKLPWGIPVPDDETQVMYVWFEALINYLSAIGYGRDDALFEQWWPHVVVIGKGINRFHSLVWPAMLIAAGIAVPRQVAVHGYITVDGQKMSKTIGNVVDPQALVDRYGVETVRYFLLRELSFESDGDFSESRLKERYVSDLSNGLGNLFSRTTNMIEKYCNGQLDVERARPALTELLQEKQKQYTDAMELYQFHKALQTVWELLSAADEYIEQHKPWELAKNTPQDVPGHLEHIALLLFESARLLQPFLPTTAATIVSAFSQDRIVKPEPLFPRLEV